MRNLSNYKLVLQGAGVLIFGPQGFLLVLLALSYAAVIPALVFVPIIVVSIAVICGLGLMFLAWFGGANNWKAYLVIGMSLASLGSLYTLSISNALFLLAGPLALIGLGLFYFMLGLGVILGTHGGLLILRRPIETDARNIPQ